MLSRFSLSSSISIVEEQKNGAKKFASNRTLASTVIKAPVGHRQKSSQYEWPNINPRLLAQFAYLLDRRVYNSKARLTLLHQQNEGHVEQLQ